MDLRRPRSLACRHPIDSHLRPSTGSANYSPQSTAPPAYWPKPLSIKYFTYLSKFSPPSSIGLSFGLSPNFFRASRPRNLVLWSLGLEPRLLPPFDVPELSALFNWPRAAGWRGRDKRGAVWRWGLPPTAGGRSLRWSLPGRLGPRRAPRAAT